jgi:hypothetical protein
LLPPPKLTSRYERIQTAIKKLRYLQDAALDAAKYFNSGKDHSAQAGEKSKELEA